MNLANHSGIIRPIYNETVSPVEFDILVIYPYFCIPVRVKIQTENYRLMNFSPKTYLIIPALLIAFTVGMFSCRSALQANRMKDCTFEFKSFSNVEVAGTNIDGVKKLSDLNMFDGAKIAAGFMSGKLPMEMTANVQIINKNKRTAAVNSLDWIILIEDTELSRGQLTDRIEVAAGSNAVIPINIKIDLSQALKSKDKGVLMNFAFNLSGKGGILPSNVTIKVKPSISVAGANVKVPGYIKVKKELSNNK